MNETPANPATDEKLMLVFSQGSAEAFTELFHRYRLPIYAFFRRRLADPTHAEELSQETFLAVLRSAARYEPRALFRTYLYAIALKIVDFGKVDPKLMNFFHSIDKLTILPQHMPQLVPSPFQESGAA